MDKKIAKQNIIKTVLFLIAVSLIIWAYFSNVEYNLNRGLDALSGATQVYE